MNDAVCSKTVCLASFIRSIRVINLKICYRLLLNKFVSIQAEIMHPELMFSLT